MSITEIVAYDKDGRIERFGLFKKLFLSLTIILIATLSFGIGRLSVVGKREPVKIEYDSQVITNSPQTTESIKANTATAINAIGKTNTEVVVSKSGTRYHYLHCGGAKQIKEENKIVFQTPAAAEAAGYTLALNCKPR